MEGLNGQISKVIGSSSVSFRKIINWTSTWVDRITVSPDRTCGGVPHGEIPTQQSVNTYDLDVCGIISPVWNMCKGAMDVGVENKAHGVSVIDLSNDDGEMTGAQQHMRGKAIIEVESGDDGEAKSWNVRLKTEDVDGMFVDVLEKLVRSTEDRWNA